MDAELAGICELLVAFVAALVAYWQRREAVGARATTREVISFFDPGDETVTLPPDPVPARSWRMSDETRRWILAGHDGTNQASLLRQIGEAEAQRMVHYTLSFQDRGGGYYEIEYGLLKGSGADEGPRKGAG